MEFFRILNDSDGRLVLSRTTGGRPNFGIRRRDRWKTIVWTAARSSVPNNAPAARPAIGVARERFAFYETDET